MAATDPTQPVGDIFALLLAFFDERVRRIVAEGVGANRGSEALGVADLVDDECREEIRRQLMVSHKTYLTRAEAAVYLQVSERSIAEWAARGANENPFPERRAGGEPRYKREDLDSWTEREQRRRRLKLAG